MTFVRYSDLVQSLHVTLQVSAYMPEGASPMSSKRLSVKHSDSSLQPVLQGRCLSIWPEAVTYWRSPATSLSALMCAGSRHRSWGREHYLGTKAEFLAAAADNPRLPRQ